MATTDFDRDKERVRNSKFADLNNSPGREGHAVMAGTFLGEFAEDTPWVHLDIAGTSETKGAHDLGPAGATGAMVRTLATLVERFGEEFFEEKAVSNFEAAFLLVFNS